MAADFCRGILCLSATFHESLVSNHDVISLSAHFLLFSTTDSTIKQLTDFYLIIIAMLE